MSKELTAKQSAIVEFVIAESTRVGRGIGFRDIAGKFDIAVNAVTGHIKAIRDKTEKTLITWEDTALGGIKPNSLRSANMAVASRLQESDDSRIGENYAVNLISGNRVAFMIFSDEGMVESGVYEIEAAVKMADQIKAPAELSVIDRLVKVAEFLVKRKVPAKVADVA